MPVTLLPKDRWQVTLLGWGRRGVNRPLTTVFEDRRVELPGALGDIPYRAEWQQVGDVHAANTFWCRQDDPDVRVIVEEDR